MNEHDSQRMAELLRQCGYQRTDRWEDADVLVVNTCSVRAKPEQKAYSTLGRFCSVKERRPDVIIGVAGCVAQQEGVQLLHRFPLLDFVIGTDKVDMLRACVEAAAQGRGGMCEVDLNGQRSMGVCVPSAPELKRFVTVMQGCNNFCSYCIVPYVRGRERSRPADEIIAEIELLIARGTKEVILLGQNVNSYGHDVPDELTFPKLLSRIGSVSGLQRIRFVTSHPKDLNEELMRAFNVVESVCEQIHLPFQSGSDGVLERMNRGYTAQDYVNKVARLRELVPDISISADVIVGFPGEREDDFARTLDLVRTVEFDGLFSFKYTPRKGTVASLWEDDVPLDEKKGRLSRLQDLQRSITHKKNRSFVGRVVEVLVEGPSRNRADEMTGRTRCNRIVNFPGRSELAGQLRQIKVTEGLPNSLRGDVQ